MRHLDLFSGIGGFALAARWVGWETVGFCEIDPYCQKVLRKHWPGVPIYDDIKTLTADAIGSRELQPQGGNQDQWGRAGNGSAKGADRKHGPVDVITAGFPCQDISHAGKQAGIDGERSGLWSELARLIGEIRPRYAVLENVSALLSGDRGRWFQRVLGDLAEVGYDCEWHCIPASSVGAPHRRDRVWIVAYPKSERYSGRSNFKRERQSDKQGRDNGVRPKPVRFSEMANPHKPRLEGWISRGLQECTSERAIGQNGSPGHGQWITEPDICRVANGIPRRVDRIRGLGNAIVPQVAQVIFEAINERH